MARRLYMDESIINACGYVEEGAQPGSAGDSQVLSAGQIVLLTSTIRSWNLETWVKKVANLSGQKLDWAFTGGRAHIHALGDQRKVALAIIGLIDEHDALYRAGFAGLGLDDGFHTYPPLPNISNPSHLLPLRSRVEAGMALGITGSEAEKLKEGDILAVLRAKKAVIDPDYYHPAAHRHREFANELNAAWRAASDFLLFDF